MDACAHDVSLHAMTDHEPSRNFNHPRATPLAVAQHAISLERAGDPQAALEMLLDRIGTGVKARLVLRTASNLAATYADFDVSTLSEPGLLNLLNNPTVDRAALAQIAMFKAMSRWPLINIIGTGETGTWDIAAKLFLDAAGEIADDALFITALETDTVQAFNLELLLIAVRTNLLQEPERLEHAPVASIALAITRQVKLNEAVWPQSNSETVGLENLSSGTAKSMLNALYEGANYTDDEAHALPTFGTITDKVSMKIGAQYADAPYPRWTSLNVPEASGRLTMARSLSNDNRLHSVKRPSVLIAGCGTGQHAIVSALGYGPKSSVLGVDLSRTSLSYAARMTKTFAVKNLTLAQGDILDIDSLGRTFDIIESIGVLHHTADPMESWRQLLNVLKPSGLMAVGVYSASARAGLSKYRAGLDHTEPPSDNVIRTLRHNMIRAPQNDFERSIIQSADFNTLSNLRDLLFNVHEIPLTLHEIRDFIDLQGLRFLGFDASPATTTRFIDAKGHDALGDLDAWIAFEGKNSDAFEAMYVFWVQALA
jgi:SAM-dependent methyltransferase